MYTRPSQHTGPLYLNMEYLCTTCSKEKRADSGLLPAVDRYTHERIALVQQIGDQQSLPLLFLSGKFGLIRADAPIPWYDQALLTSAVDSLVPVVKNQLVMLKATSILFYAESKTQPGWLPYYNLIEKSCGRLNVDLKHHVL